MTEIHGRIRAEIEVLIDESEDDFFEFSADPAAFLAANPHRATKRVVADAWVTDQDLRKHEVKRGEVIQLL